MKKKIHEKIFIIKVHSLNDWGNVAKKILDLLQPGMILALQGDLSAGKTTLVQAIARELGIKKIPRSPTFSLIRTYKLSRPALFRNLVHVDAYRIERNEDVQTLGLDELILPKNLIAIEWPENLAFWMKNRPTLFVKIFVLKKEERKVEISCG